jgi:ABC-type lipoprotein export system ATPase subunit
VNRSKGITRNGRPAWPKYAIERKENVVLLGPPGVGKTHLAISLAGAAAQAGRRVYYGTLIDLITSLEEAQAAGRLRIPRHVGPRFHVMPGRDSTACRATVPRQAGPVEG